MTVLAVFFIVKVVDPLAAFRPEQSNAEFAEAEHDPSGACSWLPSLHMLTRRDDEAKFIDSTATTTYFWLPC